jgi:hypothetical protein
MGRVEIFFPCLRAELGFALSASSVPPPPVGLRQAKLRPQQ